MLDGLSKAQQSIGEFTLNVLILWMFIGSVSAEYFAKTFCLQVPAVPSVSSKALQLVNWGRNGTILWAAKIPIAQQYWPRFVHSSHAFPQAYLYHEAQGPVKGRKSGNPGHALEIIARRTWSSKAQRVLARKRLPVSALASRRCWSDQRWVVEMSQNLSNRVSC